MGCHLYIVFKITSSKTLPVVEKGVVMVRDSKLWEEAYKSYKDRFPKSNVNKQTKHSRVVTSFKKEPMLLLEEYREILAQIKVLSKRRNAIRVEMRKHGQDPVNYTRSSYFQRPILLYVLRLKDNCWYIGMSRNVDRRFKAHQKGKSMWTKEHPPIEIFEVRETGLTSDSEAGLMEDQLTLEYARQYGTEFVRGGGYCQTKPRWPKEFYEPDLRWIQE